MLIIEFTDPSVTLEEIRDLAKEGRIRLPSGRMDALKVQPNGCVGIETMIFVPMLNRKVPKLPKELEVRYTYRQEIVDGIRPNEGVYSYGGENGGVEIMVVQRTFDRRLGVPKSVVEIIGTDLNMIEQAYMCLRTGTLKPDQDWSSPGTIEAPAPEAKEDGGQLALPQVAAPETEAA